MKIIKFTKNYRHQQQQQRQLKPPKKNFFQKIPNKNAVFGRNLEWEKQQNSISITILMLISFVEQCKRREMN